MRTAPQVKITHERLDQVEGFFDRHGGKAILIGRFVGLVRAIAPFLAGSSRMPLRRFLPYDVVGAGLWGTTFVLLGYIFWQSFDKVADYAEKGALALGAVDRRSSSAISLVRLAARPREPPRAPARGSTRRPSARCCARWPRSCGRRGASRRPPGALRLEPRDARRPRARADDAAAVAAVGSSCSSATSSMLDDARHAVGDKRALRHRRATSTRHRSSTSRRWSRTSARSRWRSVLVVGASVVLLLRGARSPRRSRSASAWR